MGSNGILPEFSAFFVRRGKNSALEMTATVCRSAEGRTELRSVIVTVLLRCEFCESRHEEGRCVLIRCLNPRDVRKPRLDFGHVQQTRNTACCVGEYVCIVDFRFIFSSLESRFCICCTSPSDRTYSEVQV